MDCHKGARIKAALPAAYPTCTAVSSTLFGLSRAMRTMKPWSGVYTINVGWGLYAFALGLFYGVIREATGDLIGSGTGNALIDGVGAIFIKAT